MTANMAGALRVMTIERGYDPRDFLLMAFGGAGPMHGCQLARAVGIRKVVIPIFPGVASALGMLITNPKFHFSRTYIARLDVGILPKVREIYQDLELQGRRESGELPSFWEVPFFQVLRYALRRARTRNQHLRFRERT